MMVTVSGWMVGSDVRHFFFSRDNNLYINFKTKKVTLGCLRLIGYLLFFSVSTRSTFEHGPGTLVLKTPRVVVVMSGHFGKVIF